MHPLVILLIGVTIVIVGVLVLRLHAFLALVLAALTVGVLTPTSATQQYWIEKYQYPPNKVAIDEENQEVFFDDAAKLHAGMQYQVMRSGSNGRIYHLVAVLDIQRLEEYTDEQGQRKSRAIARPIPQDSSQIKTNDLVIHRLDAQRAINQAKATVGKRQYDGWHAAMWYLHV